MIRTRYKTFGPFTSPIHDRRMSYFGAMHIIVAGGKSTKSFAAERKTMAQPLPPMLDLFDTWEEKICV